MDYATDGQEGLHLALTEPYYAAVIDVMLPKLDGLSLIQEVRRQNVNVPVIILSARRTVDDRVKGLSAVCLFPGLTRISSPIFEHPVLDCKSEASQHHHGRDGKEVGPPGPQGQRRED